MRVLKAEVKRIVMKSKNYPYRGYLNFYPGGAKLEELAFHSKIESWEKMIKLCADKYMDLNGEQLEWLAREDKMTHTPQEIERTPPKEAGDE